MDCSAASAYYCMAGNFRGVLYFVKSRKKAPEVIFVAVALLVTPTEIP